jgi:uncharacterized protein (DUF927 family)
MKIEYDNSNELVLIKDEEEYSFSKKEEYKEIFKILTDSSNYKLLEKLEVPKGDEIRLQILSKYINKIKEYETNKNNQENI